MQLLLTRSTLVFTVIVLVSLALIPLAQTNWADSIRTSSSQPSINEDEARMESMASLPFPFRFLPGLIRSIIFLLIPGWIAYRILNTIKKRSSRSRLKEY